MGRACANRIPFQLRLGWSLRVEGHSSSDLLFSAHEITETINTPFTIK